MSQLTLADIAGIDLNTVKEMRYEVLPKVQGIFEITECVIKMSNPFKDNKGVEYANGTPVIEADCTIREVENVIGEDIDKATLVGKVQKQSWMIKEVEEVGRFKAFCVDAGVQFDPATPVKLDDLVHGIKGLQFPGQIKHRDDKQDPTIKRASVAPTVIKDKK
jgi:hypothetical protein